MAGGGDGGSLGSLWFDVESRKYSGSLEFGQSRWRMNAVGAFGVQTDRCWIPSDSGGLSGISEWEKVMFERVSLHQARRHDSALKIDCGKEL